LQQHLEDEAKKPAEERTSEPDVVVENQSLVQTIHTDNRVTSACCISIAVAILEMGKNPYG